jgi:hypothetical protein
VKGDLVMRYRCLALLTLSAATILPFTVGCSTQRFTAQYKNELMQLEPGKSTIDDFNRTFPQSTLAGQNMINGTRIDAFEVAHRQYDPWTGNSRDELMWFYFNNKRLVQWGPPGSWPAPADVIVETRKR